MIDVYVLAQSVIILRRVTAGVSIPALLSPGDFALSSCTVLCPLAVLTRLHCNGLLSLDTSGVMGISR